MLARLWISEDADEGEGIAEEFERLSIVDTEIRVLDREQVVGLKLHDLVHDFCVMEASREEGVAFWNAALLRGYWLRTSENGEVGVSEGAIRQWRSGNVVRGRGRRVHRRE